MTYGNYNTFKSFATIDSNQHSQDLIEKIRNEIEGKGKEYILGVDEEEFKNYLIEKYTFDPLAIDYESESMDEPNVSKEWIEDRMFGERHQRDVYVFTIKYNYTGSPILFKLRPGTWVMTTNEISLNEQNNTVSYSFKLYKKTQLNSIERKAIITIVHLQILTILMGMLRAGIQD